MENNLHVTEFDQATTQKQLQLIKTLIPYMEFNTAKFLSVYIRLDELRSTINYYNNPKVSILSACSKKNSLSLNSSINDILQNQEIMGAILEYCPNEYKNIFNTIRQATQMSDLFNSTSVKSDNSDKSNSSDKSDSSDKSTSNSMLEGLLNDNQRKLYNSYNSRLMELDI